MSENNSETLLCIGNEGVPESVDKCSAPAHVDRKNSGNAAYGNFHNEKLEPIMWFYCT